MKRPNILPSLLLSTTVLLAIGSILVFTSSKLIETKPSKLCKTSIEKSKAVRN